MQNTGNKLIPERHSMLEHDEAFRINRERRRFLGSSSELAWNPVAALAARLHSQDQLARGYFDHYSPEGTDVAARLKRVGLAFHQAAENIAWIGGAAHPTRALVASMHQGLMDSPGHRANLLDRRFQALGVGIAAGRGQVFMTQVFFSEGRWWPLLALEALSSRVEELVFGRSG